MWRALRSWSLIVALLVGGCGTITKEMAVTTAIAGATSGFTFAFGSKVWSKLWKFVTGEDDDEEWEGY